MLPSRKKAPFILHSNPMVADDLEAKGPRASEAIVLNQIIPVYLRVEDLKYKVLKLCHSLRKTSAAFYGR